jgi:hypothetical protein
MAFTIERFGRVAGKYLDGFNVQAVEASQHPAVDPYPWVARLGVLNDLGTRRRKRGHLR